MFDARATVGVMQDLFLGEFIPQWQQDACREKDPVFHQDIVNVKQRKYGCWIEVILSVDILRASQLKLFAWTIKSRKVHI